MQGKSSRQLVWEMGKPALRSSGQKLGRGIDCAPRCDSSCSFAAVFGIQSTAFAQKPAWEPAPGHTSIALWPHGAPGAKANPEPEVDTTTAKENLIAGEPIIRSATYPLPLLRCTRRREKTLVLRSLFFQAVAIGY
jgi:hypothetical protein